MGEHLKKISSGLYFRIILGAKTDLLKKKSKLYVIMNLPSAER